MPIEKRKYLELKGVFKKNNIFFKVNGESRHRDEDFIEYVAGLEVEEYSAFLVGNRLWEMGAFSYSWSTLPLNIKIGRYCSIASGIKVLGTRHPYEWLTTSSSTYDRNFIIYKKYCLDNHVEHPSYNRPNPFRAHGIILHNDVWIGANVTLKPDIIIGTGGVIAANSTVVKDVPPYAIVGGNPAKIIKYRFDPMVIHDLLLSGWWNYKFTDFQKFDIRNTSNFISQFMKEKENLEPLTPSKLIL